MKRTSTLAVRRWRAANPERSRELDRKSCLKWRAKYPEHVSWSGMFKRCYDPRFKQFKDYGGRGIQVCVRWNRGTPRAFFNFLSDMGRKPTTKHTIDRINNDLSYMPSNCRWATRSEQQRNRRPQKLTKEQVFEIRVATGTHRSIATKFGVHRTMVTSIKNGKCWKHI